jgi:hypothetical protein
MFTPPIYPKIRRYLARRAGVSLDPSLGAEIRKTRPCVIVSNDVVGVLPLLFQLQAAV